MKNEKHKQKNFKTRIKKRLYKYILRLVRFLSKLPKNLISECKWLLKETKELANIFASSIMTMIGL